MWLQGGACNWLDLNYLLTLLQKKNPITFVGHGVGGIIIKNVCIPVYPARNPDVWLTKRQALTYCTARRTSFGGIVDQTHHIIFLDTPHLGLDVSKWKAVYGRLATNQAKIQFRLWSTALQDLATTFGDIVSRPGMLITTVESTEPIQTSNGETLVCMTLNHSWCREAIAEMFGQGYASRLCSSLQH